MQDRTTHCATNELPFRTSSQSPPWQWPWWRSAPKQQLILVWVVLIHVTAALGLILFPLPGWPIFLTALLLAWLGGIGTTVCYHRALAHRSVRLHPVVRELLIFFAMFNGSGAPLSWTANHRLHHAAADTPDDISSPQVGGFWWAHLRWLWQAPHADPQRYCRDMNGRSYRLWKILQVPVLTLSFFSGAVWSMPAFFWLGAIRLMFSLHGQCFVNSVCHLAPEAALHTDSSRNVPWLAVWHLGQGENWHGNHHARPGVAQLGWTRGQPDVGWWVIRLFQRLGLATEVRGL